MFFLLLTMSEAIVMQPVVEAGPKLPHHWSFHDAFPSSSSSLLKFPHWRYPFGHRKQGQHSHLIVSSHEQTQDEHEQDHIEEHDHEAHLLASSSKNLVVPEHTGGSSAKQAFLNTLTSYIGVGVYALPYAFKQTGLYSGILVMILIGVTSAYINQILINAQKFVEKTPHQGIDVNYPELGKEAFGRAGSIAVTTSIVTSQIGGCCAYLIFMGSTLATLSSEYTTQDYISMMMIAVLVLCMLHDLKYLSPVSFFANLVFMTAAMSLFVYGFRSWNPQPSYDFIRSNFFVGFGSCVFTLSAANLAIPIESSMRNPSKYNLVNKSAVSAVVILFLFVAVFGFIFYGDNSLPMIINNLPSNDKYVSAIKGLLVVQIVFTYPLQMFPVIQLCEHTFIHPDSNPYWHEFKRCLIRVVLVGFTALIASLLPFFSLISSLIGAVASSLSGFIFPAIIHSKLMRKELPMWQLAINAIIAILGGVCGIISAYYIISDIAQCVSGTAVAGTC